MHHILFICSFVGEHFGCFHLLAIVYNAAVTIRLQIHVQVSDFSSLGIYPEVELLDYMVILCLIFEACHAVFLEQVILMEV